MFQQEYDESLQTIREDKSLRFAEAATRWEAGKAEHNLLAREQFPDAQEVVTIERYAVGRDRQLAAHKALHRGELSTYETLKTCLFRYFTAKPNADSTPNAIDLSAAEQF